MAALLLGQSSAFANTTNRDSVTTAQLGGSNARELPHEDARSIVLADMRTWLDLISSLSTAHSCKIITDAELAAAATRIASIYTDALNDNGLRGAIDVQREIEAAEKKGRDAAGAATCERSFGKPEDKARIRKTAKSLAASS
jgi:hypothetical protein